MVREFLSWLGCKINKILALLSVFVLTMLLSCAFGRVLTDVELKNYCLNAYKEFYNVNVPDSVIANVVNQDFTNWLTQMQENEGRYILSCNATIGTTADGMYIYLLKYTGSASNLQNQHPYYSSSSSSIVLNNSYLTPTLYTYKMKTNEFTTTTGNNATQISVVKNYFYTDANIWNRANNSFTSIRWASGYYNPSTIFDENFITSEVWKFQSAWSDTIYLSGDTTVDYYVVDPSYIYTVFGTLQDSSLCYGAGYEILAFNKSTNTWEVVYDWGEYFTDSNPISNYFTTGVINGIPSSSIKLRSNLVVSDTIISFTFNRGYSESDLAKQIDVAFYVRGSHSVITNGVADYDSTFSDSDYYNDYQYEVDNLVNMSFDDTLNDVNENLNNDSEVPQIVSQYFGSSGEVLENLGYTDYSSQNPYGNVFLTFVNGVRQVFFDSGPVTLSCTVHGQTFSFNSDDFQNPSTGLKVFTTSTCIFVTLYSFFQLAFNFVNALTDGDFWGLTEVVRKYAGLIKYM